MSESGTVLAHDVGNSQDLPLPFDLVLQAGALTVVVSFLAISILWRVPRAAVQRRLPARWDALLRAPWWRTPLRTKVLLVALYVVGNALFGPNDQSNPAAHMVYVWLWVGLVPLSLLFGPVWRMVNPLRSLHLLLCWILRLPVSGIRPGVGRTGRWPAAFALLAFVWFELVAPDRTDPRLIGLWFSCYAVIQLGIGLVRGEQSSPSPRATPWRTMRPCLSSRVRADC